MDLSVATLLLAGLALASCKPGSTASSDPEPPTPRVEPALIATPPVAETPEAYLEETGALVDELAYALAAAANNKDNPLQGLAAAHRILDRDGPPLRARMEHIYRYTTAELSEDAAHRLRWHISNACMKVDGLAIDLMSEAMKSRELNERIKALLGQFHRLFTPPAPQPPANSRDPVEIIRGAGC